MDLADARAFLTARGRGVGTGAARAAMRDAFAELGLERPGGAIIEGHEASLALDCGRFGRTVEGRQRRWDRLLVGVTRENRKARVAAGQEARRHASPGRTRRADPAVKARRASAAMPAGKTRVAPSAAFIARILRADAAVPTPPHPAPAG